MIADEVFDAVLEEWNNFDFVKLKDSDSRFKTIAAFVCSWDDEYSVLSIGTGSKCASPQHTNWDKHRGEVLFDSHAEIMARRGFMRFLYKQLELIDNSDDPDDNVYLKRSRRYDSTKYRWNPNLKLQLYISSSPCGAASMNEDENDDDKLRIIQTASHRPKTSMTESSNDTDLSYSCSDKIASWNVLGVQDALLTYFLEPIYLDRIIVSGHIDIDQMEWALYGRIENVNINFMQQNAGYRVNEPQIYQHQIGKIKLYRLFTGYPFPRKNSASPLAHNWYYPSDTMEFINSQTGFTFDETPEISRLSKKALYRRFKALTNNEDEKQQFAGLTYWKAKESMSDYQDMKDLLFDTFKENNLGYWNRKGISLDSFNVKYPKY